jgi:hypothetical protein
MAKVKAIKDHDAARAERKAVKRQDRKWTQIGKLADDALTALGVQDVKQARALLMAIRGVALSADADKI